MKILSLSLLAGLLLLSGCASRYVVTLNNTAQITTKSKPKLKDGAWHFKDSSGQQRSIPAGRVSEVAPASMIAKSAPPAPPKPLRKHKWYFLWLA